MRLAFVGTGFVADYYRSTMAAHPELSLVGVYDQDPAQMQRFAAHYHCPKYASLAALLADPQVELVLNLTNPRSHYAVSEAAVKAGKHVYAEKPFAMTMTESKALVAAAAARGVRVVSAPCSLLSEAAQATWSALRKERVGKVRLVYAEMDDGMIHRMQYRKWRSASGAPWPYKDEFEVGCTLEHAGYYVPWLTAFFGPAASVTAFSSCLIPDKCPGEVLTPADTPDFSVGLIRFKTGVVARLTCGIVAPHDHTLTIVGDHGILCVDDCWDYRSRVYVRRHITLRRRSLISPFKERVKLGSGPGGKLTRRGAQKMDFCRGVADLAAAIKAGRPGHLTEAFSLHNTEIVLALQAAGEHSSTVKLETTFEPFGPLPWA